jgi:hypothetical protein
MEGSNVARQAGIILVRQATEGALQAMGCCGRRGRSVLGVAMPFLFLIFVVVGLAGWQKHAHVVAFLLDRLLSLLRVPNRHLSLDFAQEALSNVTHA